MQRKQKYKDPSLTNFGFIEYFRRSYENETDATRANETLHLLRTSEAQRDYFHGDLKQIQNMIQIGRPNYDLKEAQWELYKLSVSHEHTSEFLRIKDFDDIYILWICIRI